MRSPHTEFLGWQHYAAVRLARRQAGEDVGHPEWADLPASRQQAKGVFKYFTGKPCKQGHIALRYANGTCAQCVNPNAV